MSKNLMPVVFASNETREMEKVLRVLGVRIDLDRMKSNSVEEFEVTVDGMSVSGKVSKLQNHEVPAIHIGFTESDIDELISEYISDKAGVPTLDTDKVKDMERVNQIFNRAIHAPAGQGGQAPTPQSQRRSPTRNNLDVVNQAMPNDSFVQSLDQQYQRRGRLTPKQQSALQKIYDRVTNPSSVQIDPKMKARLDALVKAMPRDRFVKSLSDQYDRRGELSPKQISALEKLERGMASGGDKALIQRIDALLANTVKIKGRRKSLLTSFREQVTNGRRLSQRQLELLSQYEQL